MTPEEGIRVPIRWFAYECIMCRGAAAASSEARCLELLRRGCLRRGCWPTDPKAVYAPESYEEFRDRVMAEIGGQYASPAECSAAIDGLLRQVAEVLDR